jgi:membrane protease YdiL (CAAX protease family)
MEGDPASDPGLSPDAGDADLGIPVGLSEEALPDALTPRPWGPWATIGWTVLAIVVWVAIQIGVAIVYVAVRMVRDPKTDMSALATDGTLLGLATLVSTPAILGLVAFLIRVRGFTIREYLALEWPTPRQAALAVAGLLLGLAASDLVTYALGRPIVPTVMVQAYRSAWLPLLVLALLVLAPLGEESLIRGFLFRGLADSPIGPWITIGVCAFTWAVMHVQYDLYAISIIFLMGLYLGTVRYLTGSLPLVMLLHFVANLVATAELVVLVHGWE